MGAMTSILHAAPSISLAAQRPRASDTSSAGSSGSDSATITANDFLTLLVTEMQNQDPTADQDPNEYINQLVNVNSLQQLIQINQTLSSAVSTPVSGGVTTALATPTTSTSAATHTDTASSMVSAARRALNATPGNLGIPAASPSALTVAQSLGGNPHAPSPARR